MRRSFIARTSERQGRLIDQRRTGLHGEEEAGRLLLMSTASAIDITASPDQQAKTILRFITCGSVDDGKSTLIGRLLYDEQEHLRQSAPLARG
ncbi:MAG: hypothetical protein QM736_09105 [Vicinamibacterales bacterium]